MRSLTRSRLRTCRRRAELKRAVSAALLILVGDSAAGETRIRIDSPLWKLESAHDGIALYSSRAEGTGIVPLKAVATLPASIEEISVVLEDAARRGEWIARFGGSVLLERNSDYEQTNYVRMRMPWPLWDRTALVRASIHVSEDLRTVTIAGQSIDCCSPPHLPELVRATVYESTFQMVRRERRLTEVTALIFVDPRGNVPQWVVNLFTGREARSTLVGLRRQVGRRLYPAQAIAAFRKRMLDYASDEGRLPGGTRD